MALAAQLFDKWVRQPKALLDFMDQNVNNQNAVFPYAIRSAHDLLLQGKIALTRRRSVKGAGNDIRAVLRECTMADQFERDVAMWYGYCNSDGKGAEMCLRVFAALKRFGLFYRRAGGTWGDFGQDFPAVPVASLLSHGGRILFQFPISNSAIREVGNKTFTVIKGLTSDPITALGNRGMYHTVRGKSKGGAVALHGFLRVTGLASAGAILSTPMKTYAAGDDRLWSYFSGSDLHDRALATHSTIQTDWDDPPLLGKNRSLWFTEEKAIGSHKGSNFRDAAMGRHHYKNLALGGAGNMNPFSGVTVDKNGGHGHLYVNYRAPQYKRFGCLLLGVEGSAPGVDNQYGKVHDANATKGEFSATGGRKWSSLRPNTFYEGNNKSDVTVFVCDMSARSTSAAQGDIASANMTAANLDEPISAVAQADWTEYVRRL